MFLASETHVSGRIPGQTGHRAFSGWNTPLRGASHPLNGNTDPQPVNGESFVPEVNEPQPVRAHKSFGIKLDRCSHPAYTQSTDHNEIRQGAVYNCPLPAFLAAMQHTGTYKKHVSIKEVQAEAVSLQDDKRIKVDRYFEIKIASMNLVRTTDFFWGAGPCKMHYAQSTKKALWVSLIEKAYVKLRCMNTYETLSNAEKGPDANQVIEDLTGSQEAQVDLIAKFSDAELRTRINKAKTVPTITNLSAANSNQAHAYMVEGMDDGGSNNVMLFDALKGLSEGLSLAEFKRQYQYLMYP